MKFIYVFGESDKNTLLSQNYKLLKSDEKNEIYTFENKPGQCFSFKNMKCVFSDTLSF